RWDRKYVAKLLAISSRTSNIAVIAKFIPEADIPLFLNSADYLLFNFSDILTSAGVALALSYKKKIITPSMGCLQELSGNACIKFETGNNKALKNILLRL
ncbi:MAG: hypothetical protein KGJ59_13640, partial [Bacteroidota bacterium]|nr:hypothetical protein [Bacteroidota bacterium]